MTAADVDYLDRLRTFAAFEFSDGTLKLEASLAEQACLILCCLLPVPQLPLRLSEFWGGTQGQVWPLSSTLFTIGIHQNSKIHLSRDECFQSKAWDQSVSLISLEDTGSAVKIFQKWMGVAIPGTHCPSSLKRHNSLDHRHSHARGDCCSNKSCMLTITFCYILPKFHFFSLLQVFYYLFHSLPDTTQLYLQFSSYKLSQ